MSTFTFINDDYRRHKLRLYTAEAELLLAIDKRSKSPAKISKPTDIYAVMQDIETDYFTAYMDATGMPMTEKNNRKIFTNERSQFYVAMAMIVPAFRYDLAEEIALRHVKSETEPRL